MHANIPGIFGDPRIDESCRRPAKWAILKKSDLITTVDDRTELVASRKLNLNAIVPRRNATELIRAIIARRCLLDLNIVFIIQNNDNI